VLRAEIHSGVHNRTRWVCLIIFTLLWFWIEAISVLLPDFENMSFDMLRLTFGSDADTIEEFMLDYLSIMIRKIGWDSSGIAWFLPAMSGILIATSFGSREVQFVLTRGVSRGKYMLVNLLRYVVVILLMHLVTLLLHVVRMGGGFAFQNLDWGLFWNVYWTKSLFALGWLGPTVFIAFAVQTTFITIALSYAYLFVGYCISRIDVLRYWFPISYTDYWRDPTQLDMLHSGILVSVIYLVIFTLLSYLFFRRATIVRD